MQDSIVADGEGVGVGTEAPGTVAERAGRWSRERRTEADDAEGEAGACRSGGREGEGSGAAPEAAFAEEEVVIAGGENSMRMPCQPARGA